MAKDIDSSFQNTIKNIISFKESIISVLESKTHLVTI